MTREQLSDALLLRQVAAQDADALEALYDRHARVAFSLIMRIVRNQEVAQDLLQETFYQVWRKAGDYQGSGAAGGWIFRIARNKSLDQLRRAGARPEPAQSATEESERALWVALPGGEPVEQVAERRQVAVDIREALAQLPPEQRLCLELAYFEGMSQRQIAEHTDTPLGTVKTRVRGGMQKMERMLRGAGYAALLLVIETVGR